MHVLSAIRRWLRWKRRVRASRSSYCANLRESASSLDERAGFHFEHIDVYWGRCLGILAQVPPADILSSDLFACVVVATEAAAHDVREYCAQHAAQHLLEAWQRYELELRRLPRGVRDPREGLESCARAFHAVQALYRERLGR